MAQALQRRSSTVGGRRPRPAIPVLDGVHFGTAAVDECDALATVRKLTVELGGRATR